jgi:hypothetical protein
MMKTTIILIISLLSEISVNAQGYENLNCLGFTTTQVRGQMSKLEIGRTDMGGKSNILMMSYRDIKYGLIMFYFDKKNVCYKESFRANYSHGDLLTNAFMFSGSLKSIKKDSDYFTVEFIKN